MHAMVWHNVHIYAYMYKHGPKEIYMHMQAYMLKNFVLKTLY